MAADTVISVEALGKRYLIAHEVERARYISLRDVVTETGRSLTTSATNFIRGRRQTDAQREEFWALKDVSFTVTRGEVVGIIGHNGAGKSTLLKVLSRITEPSEGRVEICGRVASLLEVGTGFHPELSGRENIYLNGAILGMSRAEIRRKFEEIVDFAEVERFLDTPVKRYSSGMYVRLAFAVAAHLEPEILVVDEVLAVGDAEFQRKCLGKMRDVAGHGRTVLFVSHNMAAIQTLCPTSIWLKSGRLEGCGPTRALVERYLKVGARGSSSPAESRSVGSTLHLNAVTLSSAASCEPLPLSLDFEARAAGVIRECAVLVQTLQGQRVAIIDLRETGLLPLKFQPGSFAIEVEALATPLVEGPYVLGLYVVTNEFGGEVPRVAELELGPEQRGDGVAPYSPEHRGFVVLKARAEVKLR